MDTPTHNLLLVPLPHVPYSFIGVFSQAGSAYDPAHKEGLSHLTEHVLLHHLGEGAHSGAVCYTHQEGEVEKELLMFGRHQLSAHTNESLRDFLDVYFHKPLSSESFEREKRVIDLELAEFPASEAYKAGVERIFTSGSPYALPTSGTRESQRSLGFGDVEAFRREMLKPEHSLIVAVGGGIMESSVHDLAEALSVLRAAPPIRTLPPASISETIQIIREQRGELTTTHIFVPTVSAQKSRERTLLMLIRNCLGGHQRALLNRRLRTEAGYLYSLTTESHYYQSGGYFYLGFTTHEQDAEAALTITLEIMEHISRYLTEELYAEGKLALTIDLMRRTSDPEALAWLFADGYFAASDVEDLGSYIQSLDSVTHSEVLLCAQKYFTRPVKTQDLSS